MADQRAHTFHEEASLRDQTLGTIAYDQGTGGQQFKDLRNVGYLHRMRLIQRYGYQFATTAPTGLDPFATTAGALNRIRVQANSIGNLFDCTAEMTAVISFLDSQYTYGYSPFNVPYLYNVPAAPATGASVLTQEFELPFGLYLANQPYPMGMLQTALNSQEVTLFLTFRPFTATAGAAAGSSVYQGGVGLGQVTGGVTAQQIYFDPIDYPEAEPDLAYIHRWREWQVGMTANGDLEIPLIPSNYYLRLIYWPVTLIGSQLQGDSNVVSRLRLLYGGNLPPFDETIDAVQSRMGRQYGVQLPAGVIVHDWLEETHTDRDILDSSVVTALRAMLTLGGNPANPGYSANFTGAYCKVGAEELVPLARAPGVARIQGA